MQLSYRLVYFKPDTESPQLSVLFLRFDQDGDLRICIFPKREEISISLTGLRRVALERGGACQSEVRQRIEHRSDRLASRASRTRRES